MKYVISLFLVLNFIGCSSIQDEKFQKIFNKKIENHTLSISLPELKEEVITQIFTLPTPELQVDNLEASSEVFRHYIYNGYYYRASDIQPIRKDVTYTILGIKSQVAMANSAVIMNTPNKFVFWAPPYLYVGEKVSKNKSKVMVMNLPKTQQRSLQDKKNRLALANTKIKLGALGDFNLEQIKIDRLNHHQNSFLINLDQSMQTGFRSHKAEYDLIKRIDKSRASELYETAEDEFLKQKT